MNKTTRVAHILFKMNILSPKPFSSVGWGGVGWMKGEFSFEVGVGGESVHLKMHTFFLKLTPYTPNPSQVWGGVGWMKGVCI
jgi:hypothetical protein